jgi:hypothetical protein
VIYGAHGGVVVIAAAAAETPELAGLDPFFLLFTSLQYLCFFISLLLSSNQPVNCFFSFLLHSSLEQR